MKRFVAVVVLVVFACILGVAQETSKVQVFGGYQLTSADTAGLTDRQTFHGWNSDVAVRVSNHISLVGEVGGSYKSLGQDTYVPVDDLYYAKGTTKTVAAAVVTPVPSSIQPKLRMYNFLAGPRFTFSKGKISPFAQVLFGINHLSATADNVGGLSIGKNGFAMTMGGGLDLNASRHFALRLAKFDYMLHRFSMDSSLLDMNVSENLNHYRFSTGVIYKF